MLGWRCSSSPLGRCRCSFEGVLFKGITCLKVVGGPNDSIIFVTLGPGVCFGEIALLGTGGMNRRTASIKVAMEILKDNVDSDKQGSGHVMSCFYLKGKIAV